MNASFLQKSFVAALALALLAVATEMAPAQTARKIIRVGVYDSRAIAVAYANSREYQNLMKLVELDYAQAKNASNVTRMNDIQKRLQATQRRLDDQTFSTGSVAGVMAILKSSLPHLAREAGVDIIVSKYELNYQSLNVETEDVTDKLVALFHTSEQGWKWAKEIQQKPPLPLDQVPQR